MSGRWLVCFLFVLFVFVLLVCVCWSVCVSLRLVCLFVFGLFVYFVLFVFVCLFVGLFVFVCFTDVVYIVWSIFRTWFTSGLLYFGCCQNLVRGPDFGCVVWAYDLVYALYTWSVIWVRGLYFWCIEY